MRRVVGGQTADGQGGQAARPIQGDKAVVGRRFAEPRIDGREVGWDQGTVGPGGEFRAGARGRAIAAGVKGAVAKQEDVGGGGPLPVRPGVGEEGADRRGVDLPAVKLVVDILHVDQGDAQPLPPPVAGKALRRRPEAAVGDEDVVGAVGGRSPLRGDVRLDRVHRQACAGRRHGIGARLATPKSPGVGTRPLAAEWSNLDGVQRSPYVQQGGPGCGAGELKLPAAGRDADDHGITRAPKRQRVRQAPGHGEVVDQDRRKCGRCRNGIAESSWSGGRHGSCDLRLHPSL